MKESFSNFDGIKIVFDLIKEIKDNKQYLSDIDGVIGDGDHGINMSKGFMQCEEKLLEEDGDLTYSLSTLSDILISNIGGSMGPLYGMFFRGMSKATKGVEEIDSLVFAEMINNACQGVLKIGNAKVKDKTLLDCLVPAANEYNKMIENGASFIDAVDNMKVAAIAGRDSTKEMIAKVGRASRLGERSRGVIDAGAASCCIILCTMADSIKELIN